jgi:SAM-dependent methyltransferase
MTDRSSSCGVCGAPVTIPHLDAVRDYQFGGIPWTGAIKGCSACGLLQQSPMPTREEALALYPDSYTHYNFEPSRFRTTLMAIYFRDLIGLLKKLNAEPGNKLLDIGCASGEKAAFLRDKLELDVTGLEPNSRAAERARSVFGVKTINDFFPTREIAPNTFDFVYFNHVIEHVPQPVQLLNAIHDALKPGGWLIGETENVTAPSAKLFGRYWALCHIPFHLYFFSPDTLRRTFDASLLKNPEMVHKWDPSVIVISLQNYMRRNKSPQEINNAQVPGYMLWMLMTAPLAFLERKNGPVLRFWVQKRVAVVSVPVPKFANPCGTL